MSIPMSRELKEDSTGRRLVNDGVAVSIPMSRELKVWLRDLDAEHPPSCSVHPDE